MVTSEVVDVVTLNVPAVEVVVVVATVEPSSTSTIAPLAGEWLYRAGSEARD